MHSIMGYSILNWSSWAQNRAHRVVSEEAAARRCCAVGGWQADAWWSTQPWTCPETEPQHRPLHAPPDPPTPAHLQGDISYWPTAIHYSLLKISATNQKWPWRRFSISNKCCFVKLQVHLWILGNSILLFFRTPPPPQLMSKISF